MRRSFKQFEPFKTFNPPYFCPAIAGEENRQPHFHLGTLNSNGLNGAKRLNGLNGWNGGTQARAS
jgi:hypothetical protein